MIEPQNTHKVLRTVLPTESVSIIVMHPERLGDQVAFSFFDLTFHLVIPWVVLSTA